MRTRLRKQKAHDEADDGSVKAERDSVEPMSDIVNDVYVRLQADLHPPPPHRPAGGRKSEDHA